MSASDQIDKIQSEHNESASPLTSDMGADIADGSEVPIADLGRRSSNVWFTLDSRHQADMPAGPSRAINGHSHSLTTPQASMHQQDGPLDATERIFGTTAEKELA
jgi:hypothetical protein